MLFSTANKSRDVVTQLNWPCTIIMVYSSTILLITTTSQCLFLHHYEHHTKSTFKSTPNREHYFKLIDIKVGSAHVNFQEPLKQFTHNQYPEEGSAPISIMPMKHRCFVSEISLVKLYLSNCYLFISSRNKGFYKTKYITVTHNVKHGLNSDPQWSQKCIATESHMKFQTKKCN